MSTALKHAMEDAMQPYTRDNPFIERICDEGGSLKNIPDEQVPRFGKGAINATDAGDFSSLSKKLNHLGAIADAKRLEGFLA